MPETNLDDLFTSDDRLLYTEIAFAQHVRGTLKWYEGKTFAMARIERTIKRQTFAIVVKRDEPRTPGLLPAIRVYSKDEVVKMQDRLPIAQPVWYEFRDLLHKILNETPAKPDTIIMANAKDNPDYRPYCMRCSELVRMEKLAPYHWKCKCGAECDYRNV